MQTEEAIPGKRFIIGGGLESCSTNWIQSMVSTVLGHEESEHRTKFSSGVFWIPKGVVSARAKQTGARGNLQEY